MPISLTHLIATAERSFAEHTAPDPADPMNTGHPLREAAARTLRSAARRTLDVAQRLDPTPQTA